MENEPITVEEYTAYKALKEGVNIKGYETPRNRFYLFARAGPLDEAVAFILPVGDVETLVYALYSDVSKEGIPQQAKEQILSRMKEVATTQKEHFQVGQVCEKEGRLEDAVAHYEKAGQLTYCGAVSEKLGKHKEASVYYEKEAEKNRGSDTPSFLQNLLNAAINAEKANDSERATNLNEKTIEYCQKSEWNIEWIIKAASIALKLGQIERAEQLFEKIVQKEEKQERDNHSERYYDPCYDECPDINRELTGSMKFLAQRAEYIGLTSLSEKLMSKADSHKKLIEAGKKRNILTRFGRAMKHGPKR